MPAESQRPHEWRIDVSDFRLAPRELTGQQAHRVEPVPFLSQQISSTAELSYSDIDRRREVAFAQDDLSGGLASNLRFNLERSKQFRYSKGADTSVPGVVLPGPKITLLGTTTDTVEPTMAVQRGNITYFAAGPNLWQITDSNTRNIDQTLTADITCLYVWGGYLIVGLGEADNFLYRASDALGGAFTDGGVEGRFFTSVNDILYRAKTPNTLSLADSIAGPWVDFEVGDLSYDITSLEVLDQVIIVGKEDGPYGFDLDYVGVPIAKELRLQADDQVCKYALTFNRDYYCTTRQGMMRIRPSEGLKSVGLDLLADPRLPANDSRPTALTTDGRFLYALVTPTGTNGIYIWKRDFNDAWHNYLWRSDLGQGSKLLLATGKLGATSVNAVLFAYKDGVNWQLAYARFPATSDPTKDSNYTYETVTPSIVRTLDYVASYPTVKKYSDRLKHVVDSASSNRATTYVAYVDGETDPVTLGTFQKEPYSEKVLGTPLEYSRVSLELSTTSTSTTPPVIRAFHLSTSYLARTVALHTVNFMAADNLPLATGGRARGTWRDIVDKLTAFQDSKAAVEVRDEFGRTFTAYVDQFVEWQAQEKGTLEGSPMKIATCTIREIGPAES